MTPVSLRAVVMDVVAEVAPEEVPVVKSLEGLGYDEAIKRLRRRKAGREPLGFGLEEINVLISGVVWIALDEMVRNGATRVSDGVFGRLRGRLSKKPEITAPEPVFTMPDKAQRQAIHEYVEHYALAEGLPAKRAASLADAVVARLSLDGQEAS
ncbi:hypothetical protein ACFPOI_16890 [Nonomuraea angiospora]|uniref:R3H domain-containing protein n=1 Tax=Nonomuraea angiospora TaxID=46172 RepID=A0ABR9MIE4_9ACTN|nr:hypothetical protein [Nonomuraea angiospora]MBE1592315.1 hypothetical protein [Nonomuraea angiospora]